MISTQWWLDMKPMAKLALDAVRDGRTQIIPEEWKKTYDHFLENIQDWNVSRQLWWGHQIPAWHGPGGEIKVARERPPECTEEAGWTQDPDVLDTWFSSALWPFSTLGWPDATPALARFYPTNPQQTSDLETGYDILFFWVARMMMFGLHFMKEVPFRRVLLSGLIVDETGDKMSKVKGNVIDPLDLIHGAEFTEIAKKTLPGAPEAEALAKFKKAYPSAAQMGTGFPAFGADALRFTLATFPPSNKRIALALKRMEGYRFFVNKIWQATRFSLEHLKGFERQRPERPEPGGFYNRWILSRLGAALATAHEGFAAFRIDEAAVALYRFFWNDLCDWYLELCKPVFFETWGKDDALAHETRATLVHVLDASLRAMHPLMPFVTEELWQRLPAAEGRAESIALAPYPTPEEDGQRDAAVDQEMKNLQDVIGAARTVRSEHQLMKELLPLRVHTVQPELAAELLTHEKAITTLVRTSGPVMIDVVGAVGAEQERPPGTVVTSVPTGSGAAMVLVTLKGLVTADDERARVDRELKRIDKDLAALDKKLGSPGFVDRAPPEVVEESRQQKVALTEARERVAAARVLADEL